MYLFYLFHVSDSNALPNDIMDELGTNDLVSYLERTCSKKRGRLED